jgi:PII-like signaling protein
MKLHGRATRLTIVVGETDQWRQRPVYTEIIHRAHQAGLAGATAARGIAGYGASSTIHTGRTRHLSDDLPIEIVIVDTDEKIRAFLPDIDGILDGGLAILNRVKVHRYVGRARPFTPHRRRSLLRRATG